MNSNLKASLKKMLPVRMLLAPLHWVRQNAEENKLMATFREEFNTFSDLAQKSGSRFSLNARDQFPCLHDRTTFTEYDRHYILHPTWAAGVLKKIAPAEHVDISSILYFSALMSNFFKIRFFDYRPVKININNFESQHADLMNLHFDSGSVRSLSCMHTLEHIGLGRYGDPLDYDGDLKAMKELQRVLAVGGDLLIVVPVAQQARINFNAHRVYNPQQLRSYFAELELREFCLIPDSAEDGDLVINPDESLLERQHYACGCFWFSKTK